jgi:hypothetical protein
MQNDADLTDVLHIYKFLFSLVLMLQVGEMLSNSSIMRRIL